MSIACMGKKSGKAPPPTVLELRIHGIANTPAAGMLDLPVDQIEQVDGDPLAGFWTPTADAMAAGALLPPGHQHHIPRGVRREAYSWGLLARTAPGAGQALGVAVAVLIRLLWTLLIPFGLANAAYWSRAIPTSKRNDKGWRNANGAAQLRVFALALTLLYVTSASTVGLGFIAVYCAPFTARAGEPVPKRLCPELPVAVDGITSLDARLAIAALLPVVLIVGLFLVSWSGRVRFDHQMSRPGAKRKFGALPEIARRSNIAPLLAENGFWYGRLLGIATARLHLAAGLCLIGICLAWDKVFASLQGCRDLRMLLGATCRNELATGWTGQDVAVAYLGAGAVVVLFLVVCRVCIGAEASADVNPRNGHPRRNIWSGWLLLLASGLLVGTGVVLWAPWYERPEQRVVAVDRTTGSVLGLVAAPTVLVVVLVGLAIAGLGWRRGVRPRSWLTLLVLAALFVLLARIWPAPEASEGWVRTVGEYRSWALAAALLTVVIQLVLVARGGRVHPATGLPRTPVTHRVEGWAGAGPGVFMLLACGAAMTLSGLLVMGSAAWLGVPVTNVPRVYRDFGSATVVVVILLLLAAGAVAWRRLSLKYIAPAVRSTPAPLEGTDDPCALLDPLHKEQLTVGALAVLKGRRLAAAAHLAEPIVGWLAGLIGLDLLLTLAMSFVGGPGERPLEGPGQWVLATAALAIVAATVAGVQTQAGRPLGVLWDLMCFLPRAAHPFGPPSYAERVVPELRGRVDSWLDASKENRVVLSAHSLGAVLAVACLLARTKEDCTRPRVGLLTYGTQLRPYFGRFFPELLGPATLGTAACTAPQTRSDDPWEHEVHTPPDVPVPGEVSRADTVVSRLRSRSAGRPVAWVSLWRRTDFAGFPVASYGENPIDRGDEEVDRTGYLFKLATHGGDQRSLAYHCAFAEVLRRMGVCP